MKYLLKTIFILNYFRSYIFQFSKRTKKKEWCLRTEVFRRLSRDTICTLSIFCNFKDRYELILFIYFSYFSY